MVTYHVDFRYDSTLIVCIGAKDDCDEIGDIISRLVRNTVYLLEICSHFDVFFRHNDIMVGLCEHPSNSFQSKAGNYRLKKRIFLRFDYLKTTVCSSLKWFIECLHDDTNSSLVMRVFSIVAVQIGYSLLFVLTWKPILY